MCGRFVSTADTALLAAHFALDEIDTVSLGERYNVAPTQSVYTVVEHAGVRRLFGARWGFVPPWAEKITGRTPINARAETVATSPMFRQSFAKRRCLIPADGYYEWQPQTSEGQRPYKQPWYIKPDADDLLAFAGIWTTWHDPAGDGRTVVSCAILTTAALGSVAAIHDRMPVMLSQASFSQWLSASTDTQRLYDLTTGEQARRLRAYPVSTRVNSPHNEGALLIAPA